MGAGITFANMSDPVQFSTCMIRDARIRVFEGDNFEGSEWSGAGLRGNHAPESRDGPSADVIVLGAHRHQVLLGQHYPRHRTLVHRKRLDGGRCDV